MDMAGRIPVPEFARQEVRDLGSFIVRHSRTGSWPRSAGRLVEVLAEPVPRRYARIMAYFTPRQKLDLYTGALRDLLACVDSYELLDEAYAGSHARSDVGRLMDVDIQTYLPGDLLPKVDITTMACSLEARSPFLDDHRWNGRPVCPAGQGPIMDHEILLKKAMQPWLPPDLVTRRKQGFGVPLGSWLRTDLRDLSWDVLTDHTARSAACFGRKL